MADSTINNPTTNPATATPTGDQAGGRLRKVLLLLVAVVSSIALAFAIGPRSQPALAVTDLMSGVSRQVGDWGRPVDAKFTSASQNFSLNFFRQLAGDDTKGNCLVSPLSAELALGMTANGAAGHTQAQFAALLGSSSSGQLSMSNLSNYYNGLLLRVNSGKNLSLANSIWYNSNQLTNFTPRPSFLQQNANYFEAGLFRADFGLPSTTHDINSWVSDKTGGLIPQAIDQLDPTAAMLLINALHFDAKWQHPYTADSVHPDQFQLADGTTVTADFMPSEEDTYLQTADMTGFIKPYQGGRYSFVAMLPKAGLSLPDFVSSLDSQRFAAILASQSSQTVQAELPKFSYSNTHDLKTALEKLGLTDAFNPNSADFSGMSDQPLYVSDAIQKTFIQVDEAGTKAGSMTAILVTGSSAPVISHSVNLNRPFAYAIIDNSSRLPVLLGTVNNPSLRG